ncbi:MAG: hypothetical protein ACLT8E_11945 [Akkermansia sp.]
MSRYNGEQVLVVPRATFEEAGYFQGHREGGDHYLNAFMKPGPSSWTGRRRKTTPPQADHRLCHFCHQGRILHYSAAPGGGPALRTRAPSASAAISTGGPPVRP